MTGLTKSISLDCRPYGIACGQIDIGNAATDMTERMAAGILQADGSTKVEPRMDVAHVAQAVAAMARLPLDANVQFMTIMATNMPFVGRGWGGSPPKRCALPLKGRRCGPAKPDPRGPWRGACSGAMSNSIAPSLRAWGVSLALSLGEHLAGSRFQIAAGADVALGPVGILHFVHAHLGAAAQGVHEFVLADVDAHVRGDASTGGEEHQVAGTQVLLVLDGFAFGALLARGAGQFRPAISRKTCRTRPLQSKPSEASSPPHA